MRIYFKKRMSVRGISLWPFGIYLNSESVYPASPDYYQTINHELIHWRQQKEMLGLLFYVWYAIEFVLSFLMTWNAHRSYMAISFEREAYENAENMDYLEERKFWSWIKYL